MQRTARLLVAGVCAGTLLLAGCRGPVSDDAGPAISPRAPLIRSALERMVTEGRAPGAAALSRDQYGPRFASAGFSDLESRRIPLEGDRFRAGSITKTFVATVVLQLVDEGKLSLDDTVEKHLPGLVRGRGNDGRTVTVAQLLGHTSGLFDYVDDPALHARTFGRKFPEHRYDTRTPRELVRTALRHPPYFAPGKGHHYSNTDYVLLGMIIARATGRSYAEEITARIIEPLRLTGTSLPGTDSSIPQPHGRAYSLRPGSHRLVDSTELNPSTAGAAGEAISTLGDLNRFLRSLLKGELLPARELRRMQDTSHSRGTYGLGLVPLRLPCGRDTLMLWGHNGSINGSYAHVLGTPGGGHLFSYRVNTEEVGDAAAETELLRAEFCPHPFR
ncbi:serine hydrolase domain-containing protein [Streptomyces meridianus]|uniref:Beta-lactamase family protein n=1 Tax=Streptomyces meridianus TaxID=2938945 RepID=A0ABT0XD28_9ACTN|nr:serine hydrolase domain-containing protein [Streptomyces meridianus]MCM2580433.1 beta-lactamase family protein [Streptomyces meridianus]